LLIVLSSLYFQGLNAKAEGHEYGAEYGARSCNATLYSACSISLSFLLTVA
jgi:hypothetical protein